MKVREICENEMEISMKSLDSIERKCSIVLVLVFVFVFVHSGSWVAVVPTRRLSNGLYLAGGRKPVGGTDSRAGRFRMCETQQRIGVAILG